MPMKTTINTLLATSRLLPHRRFLSKPPSQSITPKAASRQAFELTSSNIPSPPTLLDDGTVDLRAALTKQNGKQADKLAAPQIKAKLNQVATIKIGELSFTVKTALAK